MHTYSYRFSCDVIERFFKDHGRGLDILGRIYGDVNKDHAIEIFRKNQHRWNIFKKLAKLCTRLSESGKYDFEFIKQRCLTSARYYSDWEHGKTWTQQQKTGKRA